MKKEAIIEKWNLKIPSGRFKKNVETPHTWNVEPGLEKYAGKGEYTARFDVKEPAFRTYLRFGAVYHSCSVYLNGKKIGEHNGSGYTPFEFDVTDAVTVGTNILRVICTNAYTKHSLPHKKDFDWANDGGIIRPVKLVEYGENGVHRSFIESDITSFLPKDKCNAAVTLRVRLAGGGTLPCEIAVIDPNGAVVFEKQAELSGGALNFNLSDAYLWSPESPKLYTLKITYPGGEYTSSFGLRRIETRGDRIFLNNREIKLVGVEWMPGGSLENGMAETRGELENNLEMLKDLNCNFTRFHWQQSEDVFDWCDRNGFMVQEEIPYWGAPKAAGAEQTEIAMRHADDMLEYHFNHPSLVCWGVGNELGGHDKATVNYVSTMYGYFKSRDKMRLVNYVSNTMSFPPKASKKQTDRDATATGDICMWNEYLGTWMKSDNFERDMRKALARSECKPMTVTEFGLCEPAHKGGDERRIKIYKEKLALYEKLGFVGWVFFCLNDYRTHVGETGKGILKQRIHGSVDIYGGKKPSYEFVKEYNAKKRAQIAKEADCGGENND